ncbi:centromere/kinetochore protein zw10 homolog [Nasonia vitripennis]|uniref:Centromere/kinetochore protein zw10 n=1 Tax=Nasonia vitripennis TaxID=7425 RepID=A0A7M7G813_NASVI|nr:centromere/kinetochore protein zw10 homolog [Nasonia vitripennis]
MSSFLRDVLIVADKQEKTDLGEQIETIKKEITKLKSVISEFMKDKYAELEPNLKPDEILLEKSEMLVGNMRHLQNRINDQMKVKLLSSSEELQTLSQELKEYNYSLFLSNQLLEIHKAFESIESYKSNKVKQYTSAAITLVQLHQLVIENDSDIRQLNIYESIKHEYQSMYDSFISEVTALWQEKVFWSDEKESKNTVSLHINGDSDELTDITNALHHVNRLTRCIETLSSKLLLNFIDPLVHCECSVECTDKSFSLQVVNTKKIPEYKAVFENLKLFYKFLHQHFNIHIENEFFLEKLSSPLLEEFSRILTVGCISKIIPTSTAELETFANIVLEIQQFQDYLVEIKFITEEQKFLSKYTNNIDNLYIDKKCEKLLEVARSIMKKDLHDSFRYKPERLELIFEENDNIIIDPKLSRHTFFLPECQISKSTEEILCLVKDILEEACHSSDKYVLRLFYTSRNIMEMYAALVPEIHRSFLETIPQQVAIFHNNCFYLAHHLLTLAYKYKSKMPNLLQEFSIIYSDQVLLLREVGSEYFLNHMKYQRDIIFEILRESGLSSIGQMPELPVTTERSLRQCIRQLELLKTVWIEILPIKVYCRALGCIVNDMADDICAKLISVEDIPADVASELVTLFNMVVKRIPQIFPEPALIEQHVQKWRKLKELIIILGASLKEIEDRWADGKGPLANEFSPQHVKQLIRALFQNTERRSNLLSKIKEK